ncbi:MAG: response regulator [Bacteriovorax sp.]|nr:response regulator [Bacteriovorax sp.]
MESNSIRMVFLLNIDEEARALANILRGLQNNLEIVIAKNMDQFALIISTEQVDCFILDWNYKDYAIVDLADKIRKSERYHQTPIAFVINPEDANISLQYSSLKVDMLISRPLNSEDLKNQLINPLNKKLGHIIPEHFEVLILDDNPDVLEIHSDYLKQLKHTKFQTCDSVSNAKKLVMEKDFDLMLLDWNLGDGTCIDLIDFMRSKKEKIRLNEALIVVITGRDDVEDIMTLLRYNVKDYIIKPFEYLEFEDKLIYALEKHTKFLKQGNF